MRVAIVGGGVIGLCCAYSLRRRGADVTVIERGRCGEGASHGNAGWVTPVLAAPLPAPGVLRQGMRWMLDPRSPLYIRPGFDPRFLWRFARASRRQACEAATAATTALAAGTPELFREWQSELGFELHSDGLLFLALRPGILDEPRLSIEEVRGLEPAVGDEVVEGHFAPEEMHVRPESFVGALARALADGVEEDRAVEDLRELDSYDAVVVAAGVHTKRLVPMPLAAAKGYSITAEPIDTMPRHPLYLYEIKVGVSPFEGALRLAGTLELGSEDLSLNRRRIDAIARGARRYLGVEVTGTEWAGLRPLLPDGQPAIGRVDERTFVATGHSMLGITLGPATAEALAPLVLTGERPEVLGPFDPLRFGRG